LTATTESAPAPRTPKQRAADARAERERSEAYHANQTKLRHEREEREAKKAREELARQVAEAQSHRRFGVTPPVGE
jgi:hypothetical protein